MAMAAQRVVDIFELDMEVVVFEVEIHGWARRLGTKIGGKALRHKEPHDLWLNRVEMEILVEIHTLQIQKVHDRHRPLIPLQVPYFSTVDPVAIPVLACVRYDP